MVPWCSIYSYCWNFCILSFLSESDWDDSHSECMKRQFHAVNELACWCFLQEEDKKLKMLGMRVAVRQQLAMVEVLEVCEGLSGENNCPVIIRKGHFFHF